MNARARTPAFSSIKGHEDVSSWPVKRLVTLMLLQAITFQVLEGAALLTTLMQRKAIRSAPGLGSLQIAGDLLAGSKPDAGFRFHVPDQLVEVTHRRAVPGYVRMQRQHEQRPVFVRAIELVPVQLEQFVG